MYKTHLHHNHPEYKGSIVGIVFYSKTISKERYLELEKHVLSEWQAGKDYLIDSLFKEYMGTGEIVDIQISDDLI